MHGTSRNFSRVLNTSSDTIPNHWWQNQKIRDIFDYVLMVFLVIIWMISAIIILFSGTYESYVDQIVVPAETFKDVESDIAPVRSLFLLRIDGKIAEKANEVKGFLKVNPYITYEDANGVSYTKFLDDSWNVPLNPDQKGVAFREYTFRVNDSEMVLFENKNSKLFFRMDSTLNVAFALHILANFHPIDMALGTIIASVILIVLYIIIIWDIIDRAFAALLASTVAVAVITAMSGLPGIKDVVSWIDIASILLLFGMMVMIGIISETGLLDSLAVHTYQFSKGNIWVLIVSLAGFGSIVTTFLDNVTTILFLTPLTIRLCEIMTLNPTPVLIIIILAANMGGIITPISDPPNIMIATNAYFQSQGITFLTFVLHMLVIYVIVMIQAFLQIRYCIYRNISSLRFGDPPHIQELKQELRTWERALGHLSFYSKDEDNVRMEILKKIEEMENVLKENRLATRVPMEDYTRTLEELRTKYKITDRTLLWKSVLVFVIVLVLFVIRSFPGLEQMPMEWIPLLGALLLIILSGYKHFETAFTRIEWITLIFFAALFVLMEALTILGLIDYIGLRTEQLILSISDDKGRLGIAIILIITITAFVSMFVGNVPVTTVMIRLVTSLAKNERLSLPVQPLVWALVLGAGIGSNGTLLAGAANIICAGVAEQHGYKMTFCDFFKVGFPVTMACLVSATVYLLICHVVFAWHD